MQLKCLVRARVYAGRGSRNVWLGAFSRPAVVSKVFLGQASRRAKPARGECSHAAPTVLDLCHRTACRLFNGSPPRADNLHIGSAGLLRGGAVAWVQVEMADTLTAAGAEFRPFLTATTSLDGSIATTYQTGAQVVVCDNTLSAALHSADTRVKVRHSANSLAKLAQSATRSASCTRSPTTSPPRLSS